MKNHAFENSDPTKFDRNCAVCEGKKRDSIHNYGPVEQPQGGSMLDLTNITDAQREALEWVLEITASDAEYYINSGNPTIDYEAEWPEVAAVRAQHMRELAKLECCEAEAGWNALAAEYEESAA